MRKIMFLILVVNSFLFSTTTIGSGQTRFDSVKKDKWKYYKIYVDKGDKISINVNNISTDVDVFYRINAKPTRRYQNDNKYLCSWENGNNDESCSKIFNRSGNVYIGVHGFKKSSYKIRVRRTKSGLPNLKPDELKSSRVNRGEWKYYILNSSKGEKVSATFTSISNRAYLYIQKGSLPTRSSQSYACKAKRLKQECKITTSFNNSEPIYIGVYGRKNSTFSFNLKTKKLNSPIRLTSNNLQRGNVNKRKMKYYQINLKPYEKLSSVITKASYRKYIYVKIGQMPTTSFFDARSSKHGQEAIVTNNTKTNKTVYIGVYGKYAGDFNIKVSTSSPRVLPSNKIMSDSAKRKEFKYYKISGSKNDTIKITLNNCSSKKYLYVKIGELPTGRKIHDDCRIKGSKSTKECSLKLTKDDTIYIAVDGRNGGSFDIKANNKNIKQTDFLQFPIKKGKKWAATLGSSAHIGRDLHAIDLNLNYHDNGKYEKDLDKGLGVYPVANGTIFYKDDKYGWIVLKHTTPLVLENGSVLKIWYSGYMHMDKRLKKKVNESVKTTDKLGVISNIKASNNHLHFAIYKHDYQKRKRGYSINLQTELKSFSTLINEWN